MAAGVAMAEVSTTPSTLARGTGELGRKETSQTSDQLRRTEHAVVMGRQASGLGVIDR